MEQSLALLLHLKGKPLVRSLDCNDADEALTDTINAARLHGHAQLIARGAIGADSVEEQVGKTKERIMRMSLAEGEFEVDIKKFEGPQDEYRLDVYCKK